MIAEKVIFISSLPKAYPAQKVFGSNGFHRLCQNLFSVLNYSQYCNIKIVLFSVKLYTT